MFKATNQIIHIINDYSPIQHYSPLITTIVITIIPVTIINYS